MVARILDGKAVAAQMRADLKTRIEAVPEALRPRLAVVLASQDPASALYVRAKQKAAEEVGIRSVQHTLLPDTPADRLLGLVRDLSADPATDGILVQLPLPKQHDARAVVGAIDPAKDVDGLHPENAGRLARGDEEGLLPCTPLGCIRLIAESGIGIRGKRAVVVGRSSLVGRPAAELLINRDATVTVCHSKTPDLRAEIEKAEILVAAIGRAEHIQGAWIRPGAVVIDVGMNRDPVTGRLSGDVSHAAASERASAITPVPGGVGPMTIAYLLENTWRAAARRRGLR